MKKFHALEAEVDSLGEGHAGAIIDCARTSSHILLPGITARFAPATSVLLASESSTNFSSRATRVDIHDSSIASLGSKPTEAVAHILSEDS